MALETGQVIEGKYRVERCIGEGGMGAVYAGENLRIKRRVAIKTLHSTVAQNGEIVARFEREAQAAGRIGSDHIMEVLDIGVLPSGERFIVMEFLDGEPLSKRIARCGQMTAPQLLPLIRQVLSGLGAAHAAGIIHRDLKPDNIFILRQKAGWTDFVKIIDFGISKFHSDQQGSMAMTRAGAIMGTPLYKSPEQANGSAEADARSDVYAVGMIMYEALAGSLPFNAKTLHELLFEIVLSELPRLATTLPDLDPAVAAIVTRATAKNREERFQTAQDMLEALEPFRTNSNRPPGASTVQIVNASLSQPGAATLPMPGVTPWGVGARTNSAFAHPSEPGRLVTPPVPKSRGPVLAGIALCGLVVLAGGGFAVSRVATGGKHTARPPAPQTISATDDTPTPPSPLPLPVALEPEATPDPQPAVAAAPPGAQAASTSAPTATTANAAERGAAPAGPAGRPNAKPAAAAAPIKKASKPDWGY